MSGGLSGWPHAAACSWRAACILHSSICNYFMVISINAAHIAGFLVDLCSSRQTFVYHAEGYCVG